jgi:hypothetical protein
VEGKVEAAVENAELAVDFSKRRPFAYLTSSPLDYFKCISLTALGDSFFQAGRATEASKIFAEAGEYTQAPLLVFRDCEFRLATCHRSAWRCCIDNLYRESTCVRFAQTLERMRASVDEQNTDSEFFIMLKTIQAVANYSVRALAWAEQQGNLLHRAFTHLVLGHAGLARVILDGSIFSHADSELHPIRNQIAEAVTCLSSAAQQDDMPRGFLTRAWLLFLEGDAHGARADLDEAWDIAERGPMRLHLADIHLHRARLFFCEKPYPWKSPQADLAAAEKLINDCGYHRRDQELADAKRAILGG